MANAHYPILGRNDYFIPDNFTKEEVENLYYGYFDNLLTYIKAYDATIQFVDNSLLTTRDYMIEFNATPTGLNDRFLESGLYLEKLGRDIEKNGTYWPIICCNTGRIKEGDHRFRALRSINSRRKVMVIAINDNTTGLLSQKVLDTFYTMNLLFPEPYIKELFKFIHQFTEFEKIGKSLYKVTSNHVSEIDQILVRYSMTVSWLLFYYHGQIKPVDFVNDEAAFYRWKKEQNL